MTEQQLSVGRIVHINGGNNVCWAAIVTQVADATHATLCVFPPSASPYPMRGVPEGTVSNHWHWPERV